MEVLDNSADVIYRYNLATDLYDYVSRSAQKVLGVTPERLKERGAAVLEERVAEHDLKEMRGRITALSEMGKDLEREPLEYHIHDDDGRKRWLSERMSFIRDGKGSVTAVLGLIRDITARVQAEESIRDSLREKEALLLEVHHRVKNNFQVVSSLLKLGGGRVHDKAALDIFQDIRSKIQSMSLIHSQLYESASFDRIDMAAYIRKLHMNLVKMYSAMHVRTSLDLDQVELSLSQAVPCGLVLNEMLTNVYRHAVPGLKEPALRLLLEREGEKTFHARVEDNGPGIGQEEMPALMKHMGFRMIRDLVEHQLGGRLEMDFSKGGVVDIRFDITAESRS